MGSNKKKTRKTSQRGGACGPNEASFTAISKDGKKFIGCEKYTPPDIEPFKFREIGPNEKSYTQKQDYEREKKAAQTAYDTYKNEELRKVTEPAKLKAKEKAEAERDKDEKEIQATSKAKTNARLKNITNRHMDVKIPAVISGRFYTTQSKANNNNAKEIIGVNIKYDIDEPLHKKIGESSEDFNKRVKIRKDYDHYLKEVKKMKEKGLTQRASYNNKSGHTDSVLHHRRTQMAHILRGFFRDVNLSHSKELTTFLEKIRSMPSQQKYNGALYKGNNGKAMPSENKHRVSLNNKRHHGQNFGQNKEGSAVRGIEDVNWDAMSETELAVLEKEALKFDFLALMYQKQLMDAKPVLKNFAQHKGNTLARTHTYIQGKKVDFTPNEIKKMENRNAETVASTLHRHKTEHNANLKAQANQKAANNPLANVVNTSRTHRVMNHKLWNTQKNTSIKSSSPWANQMMTQKKRQFGPATMSPRQQQISNELTTEKNPFTSNPYQFGKHLGLGQGQSFLKRANAQRPEAHKPVSPARTSSRRANSSSPARTSSRRANSSSPARISSRRANSSSPARTSSKRASSSSPARTSSKRASSSSPARTSSKRASSSSPARTSSKRASSSRNHHPHLKFKGFENKSNKPKHLEINYSRPFMRHVKPGQQKFYINRQNEQSQAPRSSRKSSVKNNNEGNTSNNEFGFGDE